jgi:hypothetical protein
MFSVCANPDCHALFDYRRGRIFRFHKDPPPGEGSPTSHTVQHFWLCGACCRVYTLEYRDGHAVLIKGRPETPNNPAALLFIAAT